MTIKMQDLLLLWTSFPTRKQGGKASSGENKNRRISRGETPSLVGPTTDSRVFCFYLSSLLTSWQPGILPSNGGSGGKKTKQKTKNRQALPAQSLKIPPSDHSVITHIIRHDKHTHKQTQTVANAVSQTGLAVNSWVYRCGKNSAGRRGLGDVC